jgi:serine/threonine protein kinase
MKTAPGPDNLEHVYALPNGSFLHEYEIRSVLGHGGFGITYRAFDTLLNEFVAIKEYLPSYLAVRFTNRTVGPKTEMDAEAYKNGVDAFLNEARTIARFRHPNITQVRRYFALNGTGYIVLNLEEGVSLDKILAQGRLPEKQLREVFFGALAGLEIVHNGGVLHRDIKPNNIIVRPDGSAF